MKQCEHLERLPKVVYMSEWLGEGMENLRRAESMTERLCEEVYVWRDASTEGASDV